MKYVDHVEFGKLINKFRLIKENMGPNRSSGLTMSVDEVDEAGKNKPSKIKLKLRKFMAPGDVEDYQFSSITAFDSDNQVVFRSEYKSEAAEYLAPILGLEGKFAKSKIFNYFSREDEMDNLKSELEKKKIEVDMEK